MAKNSGKAKKEAPAKVPAKTSAKTPAAPAPAAPDVPRTARLHAALCYLGVLILIPACGKQRGQAFVRFHLNQGFVLLVLGTVCGALSMAPYCDQVGLWLTLLVDALSLAGLVQALRGRAAALPLVSNLAERIHPF